MTKIFTIEDPSSSQTQPEVVHPNDEEFSSSPNPQTQALSFKPTNPGKVHMFIVDDLLISKWHERFQEFEARLLVEMKNPSNTPRLILTSFASRASRILCDWLKNLGEYRQLEIPNSPSTLGALAAIKDEFCGMKLKIK